MKVQLEPGVQAIKALPRWYNLARSTWLAGRVATFAALGLVLINFRAVRASPAIGVQKLESIRFIYGNQVVNAQSVRSPGAMPLHGSEMEHLLGARYVEKLGLLHGHGEMSFAPEGQEVLTTGTPEDYTSPGESRKEQATLRLIFSRL